MGSRFRRGVGPAAGRIISEDCMVEMTSNSLDEEFLRGGEVRHNTAKESKAKQSEDSLLRSTSSASDLDGVVVPRFAAEILNKSISRRSHGEQKEVQKMMKNIKEEPPNRLEKMETHGSQARSEKIRFRISTKRSPGRKWFSNSDDDEVEVKKTSKSAERINNQENLDLDSYDAGSIEHRGEKNKKVMLTSTKQMHSQPKGLRVSKEKECISGNMSDSSEEVAKSLSARSASKKTTNMLKHVTSAKVVSPLGGKQRAYEDERSSLSASSSPADGDTFTKRGTPSNSEHLTEVPAAKVSKKASRPSKVETGETENFPNFIVNRRTNRLKHSASGSEYSGSPRLGISNNDEVYSPGLRKRPGAFLGRPGSGVLLEGWLRQKQRRGIKGLKKWNSRYFVLYAKINEVRYYADVVQSAWGPIPLGEIGSISLRLIQRIGKRSHPKYNGCRFDITCRNSWGSHFADGYISSDEENVNNNNNTSTSLTNEKATTSKQDKNITPRASRVYSLVSDSPQVTVAWVNMLDSLLTRSANSPRPDVDSPINQTSAKSAAITSGRAKQSQAATRQHSNGLDTDWSIVPDSKEHLPKAIIYAINFIFDSTPGIETENFYEVDADATKLKTALNFLNEFANPSVTRKPTKEELEKLLDATTAGAIVLLWLKQLKEPLIPYTMYDDFVSSASAAKSTSFDLRKNLRALLGALPEKNLTMLACLLYHLNDVNVYSSKNKMDAAKLALHFTEYIIRPQKISPQDDNSKRDGELVRHLVEELITNVDTFIDEKEAQLLEDNCLL
ncbi:hypothetical protein CCR75_004701 [Bremia lactucae]|uniref:Rho GTPase-activating protein n=1 Tax=Bremia lactucae TaxID=4779 RepID=A0A976NYU2_BRELC|nr:hypothetical protein CCR75_004701 [Bremia lactucae]